MAQESSVALHLCKTTITTLSTITLKYWFSTSPTCLVKQSWCLKLVLFFSIQYLVDFLRNLDKCRCSAFSQSTIYQNFGFADF